MLRTIRNMHRTLQEAREECPDDRAILLARDDAGELERAIELLHTDAKHGMEFMIAKQGEVQAQRAHQLVRAGHRLNLLVAFFLPLTAISAVFGMNLRHGLENWESPWLFWVLLGTALATGVVLVAMVVFKLSPGSSGRTRNRKG